MLDAYCPIGAAATGRAFRSNKERLMASTNQAPQNLMNKGLSYQNIVKPIDINLNFIVDSTNGNGLGIRSLKSNGYVRNVFMHTSASPGSNNGILNPNPIAGYAIIELAGNFNRYIGGYSGVQAPLTSTSTTSLTAGDPYVITSLGNTTLAQWQAAGLQPGFIPAVGSAFIAAASASISGTGTVGIPAASQIVDISVVGDPNQTLGNSNSSLNGGAQLIVQFNAATSTSNPTLVATAPSNNSVVALMMRFDGSSVNVDGL